MSVDVDVTKIATRGWVAHGELEIPVELVADVECVGGEAVMPGVVLAAAEIDVAEFLRGSTTEQVVFESFGSISRPEEETEPVFGDRWSATEATAHPDSTLDLETRFVRTSRKQFK